MVQLLSIFLSSTGIWGPLATAIMESQKISLKVVFYGLKFEKNDSAKSNPYSKMLQQVNQVQRWESFCQQKIRVKISWHSTYNFLPLILWLEPVVESAQSRWEIVALNCYYIRVHSKIHELYFLHVVVGLFYLTKKYFSTVTLRSGILCSLAGFTNLLNL